MKTNLSEFKPNPINNEIYSQTDLTDLTNLKLTLKNHRQIEPLLVNSDNTIISRYRRYFSMLQIKGLHFVRGNSIHHNYIEVIND